MEETMRIYGLILAFIAFVPACGGTATEGPGVTIVQPLGNTEVVLGTDMNKSVPIDFSLQRFALKARGTCMPADGPYCGHAHLLIDGGACNAPGLDYNTEGATTRIAARFGYCPRSTGPHVVSLEFYDDRERPIQPGGDEQFGISEVLATIDASAP
jgi:hypothetical protein